MKILRFARLAAGFALFYGTATGVCQSIATQPSVDLRQANTVPSTAPAAPQSAHMAIKFYATNANRDGLTPKSCHDILQVMLPFIQRYPHPSDWTWFVACDEPAWAQIQLQQDHPVSSGILAITNREAHSTIIRGSAMLHSYNDDYRAQPEHIIAHELCHIYLKSSDESKVDDLASRWVKERSLVKLAGRRP